MIRPEAKSWLLRHREALAGAALAVLGFWWLAGPGGLLRLPAVGLIAGGGALLWVGRQRSRFRAAGDGQGVVQVTEGQVAYLGPVTGGALSLHEVSVLTLDRRHPPGAWVLEQPGQDSLVIPVNALGAEALFDAFASLPGLRTAHMLAALQSSDLHRTVIWRRDTRTDAHLRLH